MMSDEEEEESEMVEERSDVIKEGWKAAFDCITDCLGNWRQDLRSQAQREGFDQITWVLPEMRRQSPDEYLGTLWLGVEDALKARGERDVAITRAEMAEANCISLSKERDDAIEALKIERVPKCSSCGAPITEKCRRPPDKDCYREFCGGSRISK